MLTVGPARRRPTDERLHGARRVGGALPIARRTIAAALLAFAFAACQSKGPSAQPLPTLPNTISGQQVTYTTITTGEPNVAVPADDVLAKLGKTRADATLVAGSWTNGDIATISIASVPIAVLRGAVIDAWQAAAVVSRSAAHVAGRAVEILALRDQSVVYVYSTATVVFVVASHSPAAAEAAIKLLPVG
jgi:hypothetical protein